MTVMRCHYLNWRLVKKSEFNPCTRTKSGRKLLVLRNFETGHTVYVVKSGNEVFRRNRQFLRPAAEPSTTEKQSTKADSPEPEVTHKEKPKVPKSPSKPASPKQGSVEETVATETKVPVSAC